MKTSIKTFIFAAFLTISNIQPVFATSLDEIYRDLVKSDNQGYLPMFVKNRTAPDFLDEQSALKSVPAPKPEDTSPLDPDREIVKLENKRKIHEAKIKAEIARWNATIEKVRHGQVTAVELYEVEQRANQNNPLAVEILAWVYARGIGVQTDLPKAFRLYQQAEELRVKDAAANAAKVYKAMTPRQREELVTMPLNR